MYEAFVKQMEAARNAGERSAVISEMCRMFAFSAAKAYAVLKEAGWQSGRKKREDAGVSSIDEKTLKLAASLLQNSVRKNGKKTMSVEIARAILRQNGFTVPISNSRLKQLLKEATLSTESTAKHAPHQRMRTEYPNQVHFADPSVALLYFAPGGGQHILRDDEVYKNKPFLEGREQLKCWRYVLTDHYSSSICVRYYAAAGETAANMYDFLLYAWGKKSDPLYNFHGLPDLLIWDCGSANVSRPVTAALTALRVETKPHMPGNPRAKGQVNEAAERWCAAFNANRLEGRDTRLSRCGKKIASRLELWNRIEESQLKELPDSDICRQIFTTGVQVRTVGGDLAVSIVHPNVKTSLRYSLRSLPDIMVGMTVNVQPLLVTADAVQVSYKNHAGEIETFEVAPIEYGDAGFDMSAPVFGKEYQSPPDTLRETNLKELASLALANAGDKTPFAKATGGEGFKTHSLIHAADPFAKATTGKQIEIAAGTVEVHDIFISAVEAAKRFKARAGYIPDGFIARIKTEYPEGLPSKLVDDLVMEYTGGADSAQLA